MGSLQKLTISAAYANRDTHFVLYNDYANKTRIKLTKIRLRAYALILYEMSYKYKFVTIFSMN